MTDKRTVLVVEDEEMLLNAVTMEFEDAGFAVLSTTVRAPWSPTEAPTRRGYVLGQRRP